MSDPREKNGDRFLDVIGNSVVRYTCMMGRWTPPLPVATAWAPRESKNETFGASTGGAVGVANFNGFRMRETWGGGQFNEGKTINAGEGATFAIRRTF